MLTKVGYVEHSVVIFELLNLFKSLTTLFMLVCAPEVAPMFKNQNQLELRIKFKIRCTCISRFTKHFYVRIQELHLLKSRPKCKAQ